MRNRNIQYSIHFNMKIEIKFSISFSIIKLKFISYSNMSIKIIHSNNGIRRLLKEELDKNNVKRFSLAYSFEELDNITKKILADNKNNLEWVSIKKDGMKYIVRAEERIIKNEEVSDKPRDIVASKDAYITKVISSKGNVLVRQGEYVKKGTVLISGKITLYEDVKGVTSASGSVYGNVWYECAVETPKEISSERLTGRKRYNLNVGNKILLRNKYQNFRQKNIREIKIFGLKIKFYREEEVEIIKTKTDDEFQEEFLIELNHVCNFKKPSEDIADNFLVEIPLDKKNFN